MNLTELLDQHGVEYHLGGQHPNVRNGWIGIDCPRCGRDSGQYYLGIHLEKRYATCWRCGYVPLVDVLSQLTGESWSDLYRLLDFDSKLPSVPSTGKLRLGRVRLPSGLQALSGPHRRYLEGRGFDPNEINRLWGVRGFGPVGQYAWAIWIPIRQDGALVSWTTRSIGTADRYLSAPKDNEKISAKDVLYGEDYARHAIIICEGPIDVWAIGPGAVATMGMNVSLLQLQAMSKYPVRAVCFDAEPAAQRKAIRLMGQLSCYPGVTHNIELQSGKDAADASRGEIREIRKRILETP